MQNVDSKINTLREELLHRKIKVKDHHFTLSFSYGIEAFEEKSDLNKVIENSDKKMYDDKLKIKERVQGI
jgi:GGDEF domain-containing protein